MNACGLIVEYNPFHNGHLFHFKQSKEKTEADVVIAVMSGTFLQRGEPAIIDKFHRTKAALLSGIDVVIELPFAFSCQYADLFAKGATMTLANLGVDYICFGSEHGQIKPFIDSYMHFKQNEDDFQIYLKRHLNDGLSFPQASKKAYEQIGMNHAGLDLSLPNNILGYSYVKAIYDYNLSIKPETIKRIENNYHDETIEKQIASATSVRKEMFHENELTAKAKLALPNSTIDMLQTYKASSKLWHEWENYLTILQHLVLTKSPNELREIHGIEEGFENRLKQTVHQANSFHDWMHLLKTKRYTWTRIQRNFVHLLTNTKKEEIEHIKQMKNIPYVRLLGMSNKGQEYIQRQKKQMDIKLISNLQDMEHPLLKMEERATDAYYSVVQPSLKKALRNEELTGPIFVER